MDIFQYIYMAIIVVLGLIIGIYIKYKVIGLNTNESIKLSLITPIATVFIGTKMLYSYWVNNESKLTYKLKRTIQAFYHSLRGYPLLIAAVGRAIYAIEKDPEIKLKKERTSEVQKKSYILSELKFEWEIDYSLIEENWSDIISDLETPCYGSHI